MTVEQYEEYFKGKEMPTEIVLDGASVIKNPGQCINSHIAVLKNSPNNSTFAGFRNRLEDIYRHFEPKA